MPRDDLSIDFVRKMPQVEALDPAMILDDWTNQVANLPEEIRFIQEEIAEKDRQYNECVKIIEERDARIQKWIKAHGSHQDNPREETYRATIRENFNKAEQLSTEKLQLTQRLQLIMDKHLRRLDAQIKLLYDRNEPGFTDPDEVPSLLRPSAANHSAPSIRTINPSANPVTAALSPIVNSAAAPVVRAANPQVRATQTQQHISASAPATPAASIILNRQARESSAGPSGGVPKRGPRAGSGVGSIPMPSSGLARHSSLGPGTPKGHLTPAGGVQRAGSAGPRASSKGAAVGPGRKASTPSALPGRKKGTPAGATSSKSGLSRVKRAAKNSPSASAESELSEAESGSGDDSDAHTGSRGTPATRVGSHKPEGDGGGGGAGGGSGSGTGGGGTGRAAVARTKREDDDDDAMDVDDDEGGDDRKYCLCQNVSFGDMVACDNDACPYEWFHWSCVGLKSEPNGTWFCPVCREEKVKKGK